MASPLEIEKLKQVLANPEQYKENSKPYKKGVQMRDTQKMIVITETVQKIIIKKHVELPIMQLNAVRLIKECFELFVQEFIDMVAEKVLPIMSQIAHFQMTNQKVDRGKEYFFQENQEKNSQLESLGNSFFRLVLECIFVWAKWLPDSQYAHTYQNLVLQQITFPTPFNYFKPELINSTIKEILQRREEASRIRKEQKQGQSNIGESNITHQVEASGIRSNFDSGLNNNNKIQINQNDNQYQETQTGGGQPQHQNMDENPFVQVNTLIQDYQQIKNTLLEGLSKPTEMDQNLLVYFKQESEKFNQNAQFYSQEIIERNQEGYEDLLGKLFNEGEFAEIFIRNCNEYLQGQQSWTDLQKVFASQIKKPAQPSGQKYGDVSSTIGDYESIRIQKNMLTSDLGGAKQLVVPKQQRNEGQQSSNNHFNHQADDEEPEETIKRNTEFTEDNRKLNQQNNSKNNFSEQQYHNQEERKYQNDQHQQQNQASQEKREEYGNFGVGKKSLREALNKNEYEKYKFQLKSKTDFSKISTNQSNLSNYSQTVKKPVINKLNSYRDSNLDNTGFVDKSGLHHENYEEQNQKLQQTLQLLKTVNKERDDYKYKFEQSLQEIQRLQYEIQNYENKNQIL